jgi:membrane associated rhomboid family serine protease
MGQRGRGLIGQVLPIIILNLIFTYSVPGISAAAHVGGLLTGFVAGFVLFMAPRREPVAAYAFDPSQEPAATIEQRPVEPPE